jgi:hypothetical protein
MVRTSVLEDMERNAELGISLHVFEEHLLAAAIIEFRGAAVGMPCDPLGSFQGASFRRKFVIPVARKEWREKARGAISLGLINPHIL